MKKLLFIAIFLCLFSIPVFYVRANEPIKILLVPGHDNEVWGAQYGKIKEADMNLVVATKIFNLLKKDKRFEVHITRDDLGYTTEFVNYFSLQKESILSFQKESKQKFQEKISSGSVIKKVDVHHIAVNQDIALRLYGINKWANENKIDAVVHIHFNDYPRKSSWTIGKYKGFAIYIPEGQMINSKESKKLARNIFTELSKKYISSTYEKEKGGLVEDQSLIAIGARDTLTEKTKSILVEYGYIYQKIFRDSTTRHLAYKNMADLTFKGIKNYFFKK